MSQETFHTALRAPQLLQLGCECTTCLSPVSGHSGTSWSLLQLWGQAAPSETPLVSVPADRISPVRPHTLSIRLYHLCTRLGSKAAAVEQLGEKYSLLTPG